MKRLIRSVRQLRYAKQTDVAQPPQNTLHTLQAELAEANAKREYAENELAVLISHFEVCPIRFEPIVPSAPEEGAYINTKTNQVLTADTVTKMNAEPLMLDTQQNTFYSHEAFSKWLTYSKQHPINRKPYRKEDWVYISNIGTELCRLYATLKEREQTINRRDETINMYSEQAQCTESENVRLDDANRRLRNENKQFEQTVKELKQQRRQMQMRRRKQHKQQEHETKNNPYLKCSTTTDTTDDRDKYYHNYIERSCS